MRRLAVALTVLALLIPLASAAPVAAEGSVSASFLGHLEDRVTSGEIADSFDSSWPTISRHLAVLREAGLVVAERQGQAIRYELDTSVFQDLVQHLVEWTRPTGGTRAAERKPGRNRAQEA